MMDIGMIITLLHERGQLRKHEKWSRQKLELYQTESFNSLRQYSYKHSPFYQKFHKGLYNSPLEELPILTKQIVMEHFDEVVTDSAIHLRDVKTFVENRKANERFLGKYWVNATSGSSGK